MDVMSIVSAMMAMQAGGLQMKMAATMAKSTMDAEKSTVLTLLSAAQQNIASLANVAPGIGGNLNITA